jgi:antitoxin (DNA-binding transcriptional repressor) of toxin-antitoxin stability system
MKTVSIRELHSRTGEIVRMASRHAEIHITDNGRVVARIVPQSPAPAVPYFSQRRSTAAFKRLDESGKTGRGTDSTAMISEDREDEE